MTAVIILGLGALCIILLAAGVIIAERLDKPGTPGRPVRQAPEKTPSVLARGTSPFPMLPPDPEPDPTLMQPLDVMYLGKPSGEFVNDLFASAEQALAKHAGGES